MVSAASNAASFFVDRHIGEGRAAKIAYIEAGTDRQLSYGDLAEGSSRVAGALARIGIRPEERVALLVLDQIEFPQLFWGALKGGVIPIPLNTLLAAPIYDQILRDSRAAALFVSEALWEEVAAVLPENPYLRHIVVIGDAPEGTQRFDDFMAGAEAQPAMPVSPDEAAFWLYSSGSTGRPKGVVHVHSALRSSAETYGAEVLGITEEDRVLSAAKFFFAYGLGNASTFPLSVGAQTVIYGGRPTPQVMVETIATYRPTLFCGVPTLLAGMVAQMDTDGEPQTDLRLSISAGEALPADVGHRWQAHMGHEILDGVGSTEMLHIFLSNAPGDVEYGTSGTPVPGYEVRLVNEAGAETKVGEIGELLVKGGSSAAAYWNQRDKSRATFEGVWTRTGDKYERRADGRFIYCGRTDDMFKVSGIWLAPFEVESALVSHPAVLEAAVVARADEDGLEKPMAYVVLQSGAGDEALAEELRAHVKSQVGKWKYPRWIEFVEDLPKTATGKIQRFKLRLAS